MALFCKEAGSGKYLECCGQLFAAQCLTLPRFGRPAEVGLQQSNRESSVEVLLDFERERAISFSLTASNYILSLIHLRVLGSPTSAEVQGCPWKIGLGW
jgi:hypothetical protein